MKDSVRGRGALKRECVFAFEQWQLEAPIFRRFSKVNPLLIIS